MMCWFCCVPDVVVYGVLCISDASLPRGWRNNPVEKITVIKIEPSHFENFEVDAKNLRIFFMVDFEYC